jgi:hypothetical protein
MIQVCEPNKNRNVLILPGTNSVWLLDTFYFAGRLKPVLLPVSRLLVRLAESLGTPLGCSSEYLLALPQIYDAKEVSE